MNEDQTTACAALKAISGHAEIAAKNLERNQMWPGDITQTVQAIEKLLVFVKAAEQGNHHGYQQR
jgi:hypothetical protein